MSAGLPWCRMDTNLPSHDKILALIADPSPKRWQAAASYQFAIEWSTGHGTDGRIERYALAAVHGTETTAMLLVRHRLWEVMEPSGWRIRNFEIRQELAIVTTAKNAAQRFGAIKGNCVRHHGADCGCWRDEIGSTA